MEGSATKGLELNDCDADIRKSSIVSRMYVTGYDTSLSDHDFVMSMRELFASCGEVMHVYIPGYAGGRNLNRFALIYLRGEGAEEKALDLGRSYSRRGHKFVIESYPFHAKHHDHELAPMRDADNKQHHMITVDGYDTELPLEYVKSRLFEELSKCGRVLRIYLHKKKGGHCLIRYALVKVEGIDTIEKLLQLCGCEVKGLENMKILGVASPEIDDVSTGDMPPFSSWECSLSRTASVMAATAPEDPNLPKPPCEGEFPNLHFWNIETGVQFSKPASPIHYAREDPHLPKPWKELWDSYGWSYFWNTETNVTQYELPPSAPGSSTFCISPSSPTWGKNITTQ